MKLIDQEILRVADSALQMEKWVSWLHDMIEDAVIRTAMMGVSDKDTIVPNNIRNAVTLVASTIPPNPETLTYAGIGSRRTPSHILELMENLSRYLDSQGYVLRSGGAVGADRAFERGSTNSEIFIPWARYNQSRSQLIHVCKDAQTIAELVHPTWGKLSSTIRGLMARNTYQILGATLNTPVDFVVCWTPDGIHHERERTIHSGGTGQAIALASRWNIPVINLAASADLDMIMEIVHNAKRMYNLESQ